jgi:DNA-binding MarR family transcriptional regulator
LPSTFAAGAATRDEADGPMVRFDELSFCSYHPHMPVSNRDVAAVQRFYPQIYLACHTRHHHRRTKGAPLTPQESSILAHLDESTPIRAASLARHLGVVPSTMSAAIKRLTHLGYVVRDADGRDRRAAALRLSRQGARAMQAGSVLETTRVSAMLARLAAPDRARAIDGLGLLAAAARSLSGRGR